MKSVRCASLDTFLSRMPASSALTTVVPALITLLVKNAIQIIISLIARVDLVRKDVLAVKIERIV